MSTKKDSQKELELLFPQGKTVTIKGEEITFRPFKFGQLPKVAKLVKESMEHVKGMPLDAKFALTLYMEGGDSLIVLMAECINKDVLFLADLELDEGVALVWAFLEVNADFFFKKLLPMMNLDLSQLSQKAGLK